MSDFSITKTYSDNPFIDDMLYYVKILAFGSVVKNMQLADNAENEESLKQADILIMCTENTVPYGIFNYTKEQMLSVGVSEDLAIKILTNTTKSDNSSKYTYDDVPELLKEPLRKLAMKDFINNYDELNNYYRTLCGLPKIGDYGIPIRDYEYLLPDGNMWDATYVHEIGSSGARILESYGILQQIKSDYPDADYLDYITCGITPYKARKAYDFQLLYSPTIDNNQIADQFDTTYENNRIFIMNTYYSEAFKYNSDYYVSFMGLLIMLITMVDMLSKIQENMVKKDLLDQRCVEYLFDQYGMPYYKSIPLIYQQRICKNINTLIKEKSCAKGMFDIVNLFGAENISVFRYFILKDRLMDSWGNMLYNEITIETCEPNNLLNTVTVSKDTMDHTIPYPFEHYIEKGNKMIVWLKMSNGTYKRVPEDKYTIENYNQITFKDNFDSGAVGIKYDFYYDNRTMSDNSEVGANTDKSLIIDVDIKESSSNTFPYTPPYPGYFTDDNDIIVCVGRTLLDKTLFTINYSSRTITVDPSYFNADENRTRQVVIIYLHGKNVSTKYEQVNKEITDKTKYTLNIPEPFTNYLHNGNVMFITYGTTFISPNRYDIDKENVTVTFHSDIVLENGREITFNFLYTTSSVYKKFDLRVWEEAIVATKEMEYEFTIHPPLNQYLKTGYKIYAKKNDQWLEQDFYDVYYTTLALRNQANGLYPGDILDVIYVYGPEPKSANIITKVVRLTADATGQTVFNNIPFPIDKFFNNSGKVIIDVFGKYLSSDKYTLNEETKTLTITDTTITPIKGQSVNITFVYNNEVTDLSIRTKIDTVTVTKDNQTDFELTLPFYPYFETNQSFLLFYQSLLVDPNNITVSGTKAIIKNQEFKSGKELIIMYLYNNFYSNENAKEQIIVKDVTIKTTNEVDDNLTIKIPEPFRDYLNNGWYVSVSSNGIEIDPDIYEIVNGGLIFNKPSDILKYDNITFTFIYIQSDKLIHEITEESDDDFDLKFIGVPLEEEFFVDNIITKQNVLPYDTTTLEDVFWDGVGANDNIEVSHAEIKKEILQKKFNYERTKYFGLNYVIDIADMSFQISYFYSLLWDDVYTEKLLNISIPVINTGKSFNIGHIFCYLTSLAYLYSGIKDSIMDTPTKILYVKGFNMKADLDALEKYVRDERQDVKMYPIRKFLKPTDQIPTMNDFLVLYNNNKDVYTQIVKGMHTATKYRYYKIWKKMYDSLCIWKFNLEYFRLKDGSMAKTFTDFLKEKDNVLYVDLMSFSKIDDKSTLQEAIANRISNVVYILEDWLGGYEFHHIFDRFPGVSETALMDYIFTIINFFKSYKVVLRSKGDYITFSNKDPYINGLRPVDDLWLNINLNKMDYIYIEESMDRSSNLSYKDKFNIHDRLKIETSDKTGKDVHIYITKYDHQVISVFANGELHTDDFTVKYGTEFNCYIKADDGYVPGRLNYTNGVALQDTIISADSDATKETVNIIIIQSEHQTITVTYGSQSYTESFKLPKGEFIKIDIKADYGWSPGVLNIADMYISKDTIISATPAVQMKAHVAVDYVGAHQTFKLVYGSTTKTYIAGTTGITNPLSSVEIPYGTSYKVTITPEKGYTQGTLNHPVEGVLTDDLTSFHLSDATINHYTVHITQKPNQTITVTCNGKGYTDTFTGTYGDIWSASIVGSRSYKPGTLVVTNQYNVNIGSTRGVLTQELWVTAEDSIFVPDVTITIIQSPHQTITVICDGKEYTKTFTAPINSTFGSRITSDEHYIAGKIINPEGIITGNTTVYATAATPIDYTVTITQSPHQTIKVTTDDGTEYTNTTKLPYGTHFTVTVTPDPGYTAGTPNIPFGTVSGDTSINASKAVLKTFTITAHTPPANEDLVVEVTRDSGKEVTTVTPTDKTKVINADYSTPYYVHVTGHEGYNPGGIHLVTESNTAVGLVGSLTENLIATVDKPEIQTFDINITQSNHQRLTVVIGDKEYTETIHDVPYWTNYTVKLESTDDKYVEGEIKIEKITDDNS